jgi:hypothetical protein
MKEKLEFNNMPELDLNNEDYLTKLFESGNKEDLEKIKEYHSLSQEQVELFSYFAKMRRDVLNEMHEKLDERRVNNPIATKDELNMGAYQESIEPQVREAVNALREKGYASYESGFSGFDSQLISFEENHLQDFKMPDQVIDSFNKQGVVVEIKSDSIRMIFKKKFSQEEISTFWKEIESYLPNVEKLVKPCQLNQAITFRESQKKY